MTQTIFRLAGIALALAVSVTAQAPGITGRITDMSTQAIPGAMVTLIPERGGAARHTTSDPDGRYRFDAVPDGAYRVDFELLGFDLARRNHVRVQAGSAGSADVIIRVSTLCECIGSSIKSTSMLLTGQVVDEANYPLPHTTVEVVARSGHSETAYTDREGRFVLRAPLDDTWQLTASDSGFASLTLPVSNGSKEPLLFRLRFAGTADVADHERLARGCRCPGNLFVHEGR